jgi:rare lipoprotein A
VQVTQNVQYGIASWYGDREQGRLMASGEPFDENALTAAHRSLPFGTQVTVTNL